MNDMRVCKGLLLAAAAVILSGCPTMKTRYLSEPEPLTVQGAYVHAPSSIMMPETVAGFQRDGIFRYDVDGLDVSAGYNLYTRSHHIAATVYVYPAPSLISIGSPPEVIAEARAHLTEVEFERRKDEIYRAHSGAILVEQDNTFLAQNGDSHQGRFAIFEFEALFSGMRIQVRSHLYVFCYIKGKWAIEYRFTYPKAENAERVIQEFLQSWNWYGTGA